MTGTDIVFSGISINEDCHMNSVPVLGRSGPQRLFVLCLQRQIFRHM